MTGNTTLTFDDIRELKHLALVADWTYRSGKRRMASLVVRGLVDERTFVAHREYRITDKGIAALRAQDGGAE